MIRLRYIPPSGAPVDFESRGDATYHLTPAFAGLLANGGEVHQSTSPGQWGATAVALTATPRTVTSVVQIIGVSHEAVWTAREALAAALTVPPTRPGAEPALGVLRLTRQNLPDVEMAAVPVGSPRSERWSSHRVCEVEIEWWIPDPRWREVADRTIVLREGGGFTFPLAHPWSSLGANLTAEVENGGTAESPIVARIYGPVTDPRLTLIDADQTLELTGEVADGDYLRVDTGFARKTVTLHHADGTVVNAMGRLNLDRSDFWQLPPGVSRIRFEADDNPGGYVWLTWRNRWAGV